MWLWIFTYLQYVIFDIIKWSVLIGQKNPTFGPSIISTPPIRQLKDYGIRSFKC